MFDKNTLREMITERLAETAEEIFQLFEQAVSEYEREIDRLKWQREAKRAKLMEAGPSLLTPPPKLLLGEKDHAHPAVNKENTRLLPEELTIKEEVEVEMVTIKEEDELVACSASASSVKELQPVEKLLNMAAVVLPTASGVAQTTTNNNNNQVSVENSALNHAKELASSGLAQESHFCKFCNKSFPHENVLEIHMKSIHPTAKPPPAGTCSFSYKVYGKLSPSKTRADKRSSDPYKCLTCALTFATESHFSYHMLAKHSIDRAFMCPICKKCSKTSYLLKLHILTHSAPVAAPEEKKKLPCRVCGTVMHSEEALADHMNLHKHNYVNSKGILCRQLLMK